MHFLREGSFDFRPLDLVLLALLLLAVWISLLLERWVSGWSGWVDSPDYRNDLKWNFSEGDLFLLMNYVFSMKYGSFSPCHNDPFCFFLSNFTFILIYILIIIIFLIISCSHKHPHRIPQTLILSCISQDPAFPSNPSPLCQNMCSSLR